MKRALVVFLSSLPALAAADEVFLRSGGKMTGEVVSEDGHSVVLDVGPGKVTVSASSVVRIDRSRSPLGVYRERVARLAPDDVQGWLALAFWARERDLGTQAKEAFERVLQLDPDNASANVAIGHVQTDGRWMTEADSYRARGYVYYEGAWMTPAEQETRLKARAAEAQAAAAVRESELRVREAEARADQAEAEARRAEADQGSSYGGYGYGGGYYPLWWGGSWISRPMRPFPHRNFPLRPGHGIKPVPVPRPSTPPPAPRPMGASSGVPVRRPGGP